MANNRNKYIVGKKAKQVQKTDKHFYYLYIYFGGCFESSLKYHEAFLSKRRHCCYLCSCEEKKNNKATMVRD